MPDSTPTAPFMSKEEAHRRLLLQIEGLNHLRLEIPCLECGKWTKLVLLFRCYQCGSWLCDACGAMHWPDAAAKKEDYPNPSPGRKVDPKPDEQGVPMGVPPVTVIQERDRTCKEADHGQQNASEFTSNCLSTVGPGQEQS